jgi:hypothetical protein
MDDNAKSVIFNQVTETADKIIRDAIKWMKESEVKDNVKTKFGNSFTIDDARKEAIESLALARDENYNKGWKKSYRQGYIDAYEEFLYVLQRL